MKRHKFFERANTYIVSITTKQGKRALYHVAAYDWLQAKETTKARYGALIAFFIPNHYSNPNKYKFGSWSWIQDIAADGGLI